VTRITSEKGGKKERKEERETEFRKISGEA
jgi:hypothetical protein